MRRNKRATHVTFVVFKAMTPNERATDMIFVVLQNVRRFYRHEAKKARYTCNIRRSLSHEARQTLHVKYTSLFQPWGETSALQWNIGRSSWGEKRSSFRWSPFADIFQPLHTLDVAIIFSKCLASWHAARPMSSCQNNPSPSDPIDSVSRHFPPPSLSKSVSLLRNEMWRVRWNLSTATRLHRVRCSPLADIFHLLLYSTLL